VKKGTFSEYKLPVVAQSLELEREEAIIEIANLIEDDAVIVCTTGMPSRELFEHRARTGGHHHTDFLTVGGMGHASQIALGMAMNQPELPVYCIDGDGAALMHMGSFAISGTSGNSNFTHLIVNNGAHESVGGQPTVGMEIDFPKIAAGCGYKYAVRVSNKDEIQDSLKKAKEVNGPTLIEVFVRSGHRADIGRPTKTPLENKKALMNFIKNKL